MRSSSETGRVESSRWACSVGVYQSSEVWGLLTVPILHASIIRRASTRLPNRFSLRHSSCSRPLITARTRSASVCPALCSATGRRYLGATKVLQAMSSRFHCLRRSHRACRVLGSVHLVAVSCVAHSQGGQRPLLVPLGCNHPRCRESATTGLRTKTPETKSSDHR